MRGLKDKDTARTIMDGQRIYYNFIRPHVSLNGKTPAGQAKIHLNLKDNKWLILIRKSKEGH